MNVMHMLIRWFDGGGMVVSSFVMVACSNPTVDKTLAVKRGKEANNKMFNLWFLSWNVLSLQENIASCLVLKMTENFPLI